MFPCLGREKGQDAKRTEPMADQIPRSGALESGLRHSQASKTLLFQRRLPREYSIRAISTATMRNLIRHLRSKRRWPAGRFSSSTNMEACERFVLNHEIGNRNGFGYRRFGNLVRPFPYYFVPSHAPLELLKDYPHHDSRALECRLPTTNRRVRDDMTAQFDPARLAGLFRFHADIRLCDGRSQIASEPTFRLWNPTRAPLPRLRLSNAAVRRLWQRGNKPTSRSQWTRLPRPLLSSHRRKQSNGR